MYVDYLAVAAAGFLGAVTRALVSSASNGLFSSAVPFGTLVVNLTGSFVLSFFMFFSLDRLRVNPRLRLAVGTGFLGAYTTFSTFALESVELIREGQAGLFLVYLLATPLGCVLMAWLGAVLSKAVAEDKSSTPENQ